MNDAKEYWANREVAKFYERAGHQVDVLIEAFGQEPFESALEFGCGVGRNIFELSREFPHAKFSGIDVNSKAIERGRKIFPGISIEVGDETVLKSRKKVDVIFTCSVLCHMKNVASVLRDANSDRLILLEPKIISYDAVPHSYPYDYRWELNQTGWIVTSMRPTPIGTEQCQPYYVTHHAKKIRKT